MAVVMNMVWDGVTPDHYEELRKRVNWEGDIPEGAIFHVASFTENAIHVTDVWESAEHFQHFVDTRLMPKVKEIGVQGQPKIEIRPAYAVFDPACAPTYKRA